MKTCTHTLCASLELERHKVRLKSAGLFRSEYTSTAMERGVFSHPWNYGLVDYTCMYTLPPPILFQSENTLLSPT